MADAAAISELLAAAGAPAPPREVAARLERLLAQPGTALLAVEWGPPAGLVAAQWLHTVHAAAPVAQVGTLLVAPDDRRRGVGRLLLKAASQAARLAGCATVRIAGADPSVQAFCAATGFAPEGAAFVRPLRKARPDPPGG